MFVCVYSNIYYILFTTNIIIITTTMTYLIFGALKSINKLNVGRFDFYS